MIRITVCAFLLLGCPAELLAQGSAPSGLSSPVVASPKPAAKGSAPAAKESLAKPAQKDPVKAAAGGNVLAPTDQPVTTEVYANEAFFDSKESIGTFSGRVIVKDPRFNIQSDKLTVYMGKGEERGLDRAIAEGNVAVVRDAPGEEGGAPVRSVGRADRAVYTAKDGNVELSGTPRVASGFNTHVATSPDTVMLINQSGQLTTRGPSRTEIRQESKAGPTPKP